MIEDFLMVASPTVWLGVGRDSAGEGGSRWTGDALERLACLHGRADKSFSEHFAVVDEEYRAFSDDTAP